MIDQAAKLRSKFNGKSIAKTIAVISGKGGVGKSNTALNFALELQNHGKKVLLFDLDISMGNIDILIGQQAKRSIVDLFNDFTSIHDIIELGPKGLSYIAGGKSLTEIVQLNEGKLQFFFTQYEEVSLLYDYIIFDIGAGLTESSLSFILAADECFVITTPEPPAITDAYSMIKYLSLQASDLTTYVVMNRAETIKEGQQFLLKFSNIVKKFLDIEIIKLGILPDDKIVSQAVKRQIPYTLLKENAPVSKELKNIVQRYLTTDEVELLSERPTFIYKLKRLLTVGKNS